MISLKETYLSLPSNRRNPFQQKLKDKLGWSRSLFFKKINNERKLKPSEEVIFDTLVRIEEIRQLKTLIKKYPNALAGDDI
jgi:hypothetical protein